jgi:O-succinylhomoserine sulfhydrylase
MYNKDNKENIANSSLETKLVRGGTQRSNFGETSEAIFMNSGFCYNDAETAEKRFNGDQPGYVYSRYTNPSLRMLEEKMILLEEGAEEAIVMASGMAAVFSAIMCDIKPGDRLVANKVLFGSCHYIVHNILPRFGVEIEVVASDDKEHWQNAINEKTTHVFIESPANPTLDLADLQFIGDLCKKANHGSGCRFIVDNIFAGPILQSPFKFGADTIVYSTTKHIDGQGRTLGGAVLSNDAEWLKEILLPFFRHTGPAMSTFNAWLTLKSLETYSLRLEKHCNNASKLAEFLESHEKIEKVLYPGLKSHPHHDICKKQMQNGGPMIVFEVKGGKQASFNFLNSLGIIDISNNLGDSKSLITHPASTTHSNIEKSVKDEIGITEGLLRFSVGIENVDDLIKDIDQALS